MKYEGIVYRPPSEANSTIIQVAIGCSHNSCTFCTMYKGKQFRVRNIEEVIDELQELYNKTGNSARKFFLADGDALVLKTDHLVKIINTINELFPGSKITTYATPKDILNKSEDDLALLNSLGITMLYIGIESGCDKVLEFVKKGVTSKEIIEAGKKAKTAGFKLSVMIISGLGGKSLKDEHAIESAHVISEIKPDYFSLLTLMVDRDSELNELIVNNTFKLLNPYEVMEETLLMIKNINVDNTIFRSNHASNYVSLAGVLPQDKPILVEKITKALENSEFKDENYRGL